MELKIDPEFRDLLPPLTEDEYKGLEKLILAEGVREPIITWRGTIIDGHNRYRICQEHGIEFKTTEREFESRDAAKIFIVSNQLSRRNLNDAKRMNVSLKLEPSIAAEAKRQQGARNDICPKSDKSKPIHTMQVMADIADVGKTKMREYKQISEKADEGDPVAIREREALLSGDKKSVHGAHVKVFGSKPRKPSETTTEDGRRICAMCGEPIEPGEAHAARPTVHKKCELEYQRDWEREKRKQAKPQYTDDGRRICSICGEPINEGEAYDYEPTFHKKCRTNQHVIAQRRYRDADHDLRENVAVYNIKSLTTEMLSSATMLRDGIEQSIRINESMGVTLTKRQKSQLDKAIAKVFEVIQSIRDCEKQ